MFWKVAGFSQPSPIEQILDKNEFTLEELLDEDDIIQECKTLNGRLVAFLRERSTVEQLVRYLVDPPLDADDPKRAYKYPFTACEVFCCEVEAVFNTLLEDSELMQLLFTLVDSPAPLSSKTAGYFGRVVGHLLLRKTNEVMQYLQDQPQVLDRLVHHVDNTSVAEILKRLVGADEQSSVLFLAQYATWLAETPLCERLLDKLAQGSSAEAQANAADILCAIAHTQPSALASKLARQEGISALFTHAMAPGQQVLVPALDVCIALIEPRRSTQAMEEAPMQDAAYRAKVAAVEAIVQYVPSLVELMQSANSSSPSTAAAPPGSGVPSVLPLPYGLLSPPLGRARLKAVELLAVLLRSGSPAVETAVIKADAVQLCLQLFASFPFNNLLHHCVVAMLVAILTKSSSTMLQHIFEDCKLLEWIINLPVDIRPMPIPGQEALAESKPPIRAGYMGHVTQIASTLESFSSQAHEVSSLQGAGEEAQIGSSGQQQAATGEEAGAAGYLDRSQAWQAYLRDVLQPRQELENTARWACGRPTATELAGLDSDGDEFQAEMELEHMVGMQPVLYHRYHVDENEDDDDADDEDDDEEQTLLKASAYGAQAVTDAMGNIDLNDNNPWQHSHFGQLGQYADEDKEAHIQGITAHLSSSSRETGMEDDEVLLATSDEEESLRPDAATQAPHAGDTQSAENYTALEEGMAVSFPAPAPTGQPQAHAEDSEAPAHAAGGMTWQPQ